MDELRSPGVIDGAAMAGRPPGWYPDPWYPKGLRYFDGVVWTPHAAVAPKGPHPTLPFQVAVGALLSMALPLVASRFLLRALAGQHWPIAVYVAMVALLAYGPPLVFWRYASRRWGSGSPLADIGCSIRGVDAGWGPLTYVASFIGQIAMGLIVLALHIPIQSNTDAIRAARDNPGYVIPMLIVAVAAAPVVEEIVFRGLVMRGLLSRFGPVLAVGAQGVLFGVAHFDPVRGRGNIGLIMVLSTVGVMLGGSCYLIRRLAPNMIAHALMNSIAMAIVLSGWTPRK